MLLARREPLAALTSMLVRRIETQATSEMEACRVDARLRAIRLPLQSLQPL